MAKRPPAGRCVHCLAFCDSLTWDHGYPASWYPEGPSVAKPKAPSCWPCQERLEAIEVRALVPFALSLAPGDPRGAGVADAVRRSIDPSLAKTERERRAREAKRSEVISRVVHPESSHGAFPGFGAADVGVQRGPALRQSASDVLAVGEKFVRVALWTRRNHQFVEPTHRVETHVVHAADASGVEAIVRGGDALAIAPGAQITIRTTVDDPCTHLILFELWGRLTLHASVTPRDASHPAHG
jgi:hypothetical protein